LLRPWESIPETETVVYMDQPFELNSQRSQVESTLTGLSVVLLTTRELKDISKYHLLP